MKRRFGWLAVLGLVVTAGSFFGRVQLDQLLGAGNSVVVAIVGILGSFTGLFGCVFGPGISEARHHERLRQRLATQGKRVRVPVRHIQNMRRHAGGEIYVKITVRTVGDTEAIFKTYVPGNKVPEAGDEITILYDPADPSIAAPF